MNNVVRSTLSKLLIGLEITLKKKRELRGEEKQQINHAVSDEDEDVD